MRYQINIQQLSNRFMASLKDIDTNNETVIDAPTLYDLMELAQRAIESHQRNKSKKSLRRSICREP